MWILTDCAGENAYTEDGMFVPLDSQGLLDAAKFDTRDEAERVQFVLKWGLQCYVELKEVSDAC